jgi:hypothetical protein
MDIGKLKALSRHACRRWEALTRESEWKRTATGWYWANGVEFHTVEGVSRDHIKRARQAAYRRAMELFQQLREERHTG